MTELSYSMIIVVHAGHIPTCYQLLISPSTTYFQAYFVTVYGRHLRNSLCVFSFTILAHDFVVLALPFFSNHIHSFFSSFTSLYNYFASASY